MTELDSHRPVTAVWEITFGCNMRCRHCGSSCASARPDELTTMEAYDLCEDIGRLELMYVTLSGGEPFLREDWHLIARKLSDCGVVPVIISNGWLIDEDIITKAKWAGVSNIGISLDGLEDSHDFIRKKGSFGRIMDALRLMKDMEYSSSVITCLTKMSLPQLPQLKETLVEKGVDSWQVQLAVPMGNLLRNRDLLLDPADIDRVIEFAYETNLEGRIAVHPADCIGYYHKKEVEIRRMRSYFENDDGIWRGCPAGKNSFGLRCNGDVIGCTSIRDDSFIEGNIRRSPLNEIWMREGSFSWNRTQTKADLGGFCGQCQYGSLCLGGCSNSKLTFAGDLSENPYCSFRTAVEEKRKLLESETDLPALIAEGERLLEEEDFHFAHIHLERALALEPGNRSLIDQLGYVHFQMENYERSLEYNQRSLEMNPGHAYALKGRGLCLARLGRLEEGIASLRQAVQAAPPEFVDPILDLAVVYYENGQDSEALDLLEKERSRSELVRAASEEFYSLLKEKER